MLGSLYLLCDFMVVTDADREVLIDWEFRWSSNGWFCSIYRVGGLVDYYSDLILGPLINKIKYRTKWIRCSIITQRLRYTCINLGTDQI